MEVKKDDLLKNIIKASGYTPILQRLRDTIINRGDGVSHINKPWKESEIILPGN